MFSWEQRECERERERDRERERERERCTFVHKWGSESKLTLVASSHFRFSANKRKKEKKKERKIIKKIKDVVITLYY